MPRLLPPRPIDAAARGAAYLNAVAMRLQPGWGQFLDDCRLRLPASHPLNAMTLAASAELVVERDGRVGDVQLASSGNADFDRAVRDAIADAAPLGPPPAELLSDDDRVHLRWLFARDRRQAGPATAQVVDVELPLREVVSRRIAAGELARAAARINRAPLGDDREDATRELMIAVLRGTLVRGDSAARGAAVAAVRRARLTELAPDLRALLGVASELELRIAAIDTLGELGDRAAADAIARSLPDDLRAQPRLALAEARALAALGMPEVAIAAVRAVLDDARVTGEARAIALETASVLPALATERAPHLGKGDPRLRAAACKAASAAALDAVATWLSAGLRDPDASVRAACIDAARAQSAAHRDDRRAQAFVGRIRELARDRDAVVRAHAFAALELDPEHLPRGFDDPAAVVRAAYATAIPTPPSPQQASDLRALLEDRDPDVRAAAWTREAQLRLDPEHDARAAADPSPQVRLAALPVLPRKARELASSIDDSPDVRGEALVLYARELGHPRADKILVGDIARIPMPDWLWWTHRAQAWLLLR